MADRVKQSETEKELDRHLERFSELEKEKGRVLAQYKKYLAAVKNKKYA